MKDSYIAAKERWAAKMAGKAKPAVRSKDRLPPGQRQVHNFPVLDLGVQPEVPLDKWELKIGGKVENPVTLSWKDFLALPQFTDVSDFHCVTTWSQFDMEFAGVAFFTLAEQKLMPEDYLKHFPTWRNGRRPAENRSIVAAVRAPTLEDAPAPLGVSGAHFG